jgi:phage terminase large subunit
MLELTISLQEKQKLFREAVKNHSVSLYGGGKGSGKSYALRSIVLLRRFEYPGSVGAIFRKTFPELENNHIRPMFQEHPGLRQFWNESKKTLTLPNGSVMQFCHCSNEADVSIHQGREYSDLAIDEAGNWTETMFRTLQGSNRSSKPNIPARALLSANPGGIGHSWLKRLFVDRKFRDRERPQDYFFVPAVVGDNQALVLNDPEYLHRLQAEPNETLRRAYLYGDWSVIAGAYFTEIRREIHLIKPFDIPKHWKRFGAYDYGYGHPAAFGWFCVDEDGNVFMYRELVQAKMRVDQFAKKVKELEDPNKLEYIVAGLDCWTDKRTGMSGKNVAPTIAEEFQNHGISLSKANVGRIQGAVQVRNYLAWEDLTDGRELPRFFMFDTCRITFDCLTRMEHDPDRLEDVLKVDAIEGDPDTGDDPYDMVRYALMSRPPLTERPRQNLKHGSEAWAKREAEEMEEMILQQFQDKRDIEAGLKLPDDPWSKDLGGFDNDW